MQDHIAATPKKKKRDTVFTQDIIDFTTTFKPMNKKKIELKMKNEDSKVVIIPPTRNASLSALFLSIFTKEFLDELIEYHSNNLENLPAIFSKNNNTRTYPDIQQAKRDFIIQFYATKLYILSDPKYTLLENFNSGTSIVVPGYEDYAMSFAIFEKMNVHFTILVDLCASMKSTKNAKRIICMLDGPKARLVIGFARVQFSGLLLVSHI